MYGQVEALSSQDLDRVEREERTEGATVIGRETTAGYRNLLRWILAFLRQNCIAYKAGQTRLVDAAD